MSNTEKLIGKFIESISQDSDGKNSYVIIKFVGGGKATIVSYLQGDHGVSQLQVNLGGLTSESIKGKKIINAKEELDSDNVNKYIITVTGKEKEDPSHNIEIQAFSSSDMSSSSLDINLYEQFQYVAESLEESMINEHTGSFGPMAASNNYDRATRELVSRVSNIEQQIWNSGYKDMERKWDDYADQLLYDDIEDKSLYWEELSDEELESAISFGESLLRKKGRGRTF